MTTEELDRIVLDVPDMPGVYLWAEYVTERIAVLRYGKIVGRISREEIEKADGKISALVRKIINGAV